MYEIEGLGVMSEYVITLYDMKPTLFNHLGECTDPGLYRGHKGHIGQADLPWV
jgi:hypothetical protein